MDDPRQQGPPGPDDPPRYGADEAQRLLRDALGDMAGLGSPGKSGAHDLQCVGPCPICRTADLIRATAPAEFQEHWAAWQREILLAARAILDHYLERVDERRQTGVRVEDIPIE